MTVRASGLEVPDPADDPDVPASFNTFATSLETNFPDNADLADHAADTVSVHGISDTAQLYRVGGTDVAVGDGGTGASTAPNARTNLGLVIGTDVSAPHAHPYAGTSHAHVDADLPAGIARDAEVTSAISTHAATPHAGDHPDGDHATLATSAALTAHTGDSGIHGGGGGEGGPHPDLATHEALGLATDADLTAHAATSHGTAHPDLTTHESLGLATDADLTAHAATSHGTAHPDLATHDALGLVPDTLITASGMGVVVHGATAGTTRASGYAVIHWIGSVTPTNAVNGDLWTDTA